MEHRYVWGIDMIVITVKVGMKVENQKPDTQKCQETQTEPLQYLSLLGSNTVP